MDILKKIFPLSFSFKQDKNIVELIVNLLIYIVVGAVIGFAIGVFASIPILGWVFSICGGLVELYVLVGIVLSVLSFLKILN